VLSIRKGCALAVGKLIGDDEDDRSVVDVHGQAAVIYRKTRELSVTSVIHIVMLFMMII
jgi:hypothetical protein